MNLLLPSLFAFSVLFCFSGAGTRALGTMNARQGSLPATPIVVLLWCPGPRRLVLLLIRAQEDPCSDSLWLYCMGSSFSYSFSVFQPKAPRNRPALEPPAFSTCCIEEKSPQENHGVSELKSIKKTIGFKLVLWELREYSRKHEFAVGLLLSGNKDILWYHVVRGY